MRGGEPGGAPWAEARALLRSGERGRAEALLREALRARPDEPEGLALLGGLLAGRGEGEAAEELFRAALRADGEHGPSQEGLAGILAATGRADEAVVLLRARLEREPGDASTWRALGIAFCRAAGLEPDPERRSYLFAQAEGALQQALGVGGWEEGLAVTLAASRAGRGLREETLAVLGEAVDQLEDAGTRLRLLGEALLYQVLWDRTEEAAGGAVRLKALAGAAPSELEGVLRRLAAEARRMAQAGSEWRSRAMILVELLERIAG